MANEFIEIRGAREHNLKNLNLNLPRNKFIVITGLSGSGKSSLAFDTIYAEGRRRYVESLSAYARQFLGELQKPDVDYIGGLSPSISIDQKGPSHNPRSTVGTVTEIYDYLRLLFARIGKPHCPQCGRLIYPQTIQQMTDQILNLPENSKILILAPLIRGRKGEYQKLLDEIRRKGFTRVRVDNLVYELGEEIPLDKNKKHDIEVIIDRLTLKADVAGRLAESLEIALKLSNGLAKAAIVDGEELLFSEKMSCVVCGISIEEVSPRLFSFNSPFGACPECLGIGHKLELDPDLVIPDNNLSLYEGALVPWGKPVRDFRHHAAESWYWDRVRQAAHHHPLDFELPFKKLSPAQQKWLLYGDEFFEGAITILERRYRETESDYVRWEIEKYMRQRACPLCKGTRLKKEALSVTLHHKNIAEVCALPVNKILPFMDNLKLSLKEERIATPILKEVKARLNFLLDVGLDYLTLHRTTNTLAGGEAQRIRLATQIGSGLAGVLYILDEPSIGLHQRDNQRLISTLKSLRDLGNTVIVVEHDEETMRASDFMVDIGPGAGVHGGEVVATGTAAQIAEHPLSITGKYLRKELAIPLPRTRRALTGKWLTVQGAQENNLKNLEVKIPLGVFTCITGVSGSGKSTLVNDILYHALAGIFYHSKERAGKHKTITGWEHLDKVIIIDQSPIGRTPRSNPATYTGVFDPIRQLFSQVPESRKRGYLPGRFSFNVKGGRCEACQGEGIIKIEMHFLPDVYVPCEICKGKRYNRETLEIEYKGKTIYNILDMTIDEASDFFAAIPKISNKLKTIKDVGLGYIHLGQPATTLSGGEAQRVKLASELSRRATGSTLYILDEPTTGLHFHDVARLLEVLQRLAEGGNSVIVIEHNLDVIKSADYIIDLGPEGGEAGGTIVAQGSPEEVAECASSYTGNYLQKILWQLQVQD